MRLAEGGIAKRADCIAKRRPLPSRKWQFSAAADVAKSVDAADLKSASPGECGFKSRRPHQHAAARRLAGDEPLGGWIPELNDLFL